MAKGPIPPTPHRPGSYQKEFWPDQLNLFNECPECFYRKHVHREYVPERFSRGMLRGSATHKALAACFNARLDGELLEETPHQLAQRFLPRHLYERHASAADWAEDAEEVATLVRRGVALVPDDAVILDVERVFDFVMPTTSPIHGTTLRGRVDLVIRRRDTIEHIEFKTGYAGADLLQEVICRIGVCLVYNGSGLPVFSTVRQLSANQLYTLDGDEEQKRVAVQTIERTVQEIWSSTTWPARACNRCKFCSFADTLCSLHGDWSRRTRSEGG